MLLCSGFSWGRPVAPELRRRARQHRHTFSASMMGFERVVSSEREVTFYRDLLGLQVGGVTFNIPEEAQAHFGFKKALHGLPQLPGKRVAE